MYRKGAEWLDVGPMNDGYWVSIQSDACLFVGHARRDGDALNIALDDWRPGASLRVEHAGRGSIDIHPDTDDDRFDPSYFCRGNASLAGRYAPVTAPALRLGRIEHGEAGPVFRPCGSRLRYGLTISGGLSLPPAGPVELSVGAGTGERSCGRRRPLRRYRHPPRCHTLARELPRPRLCVGISTTAK
ncbi:MAG TPA: hypothetical protein VIM98_10880 [Dyella sp.]|uniref:hypothetical protein n=1 Tax=Dyella sp. TaxID=1869338 RepID=UPI002F934CF2